MALFFPESHSIQNSNQFIMIAILAEKPSVGHDIARVLGVTDKKDGYIEGENYIVTWAYGHLITPALPEDYGIDSFNLESLPILPDEFKLVPRKIKTPQGYNTDKSALKQLNVIKSVFNRCDSIIVATDAGREGELIFRYIFHYLECKKPFLRLWISSLTDTAIRQGMDNLKDGKHYDPIYFSAKSRSEADWMVGINASRALCVCSGNGNNSLGRVQTPTLALICKRYIENMQFNSKPYWKFIIHVTESDHTFPVRSIENYTNKKQAEKLFTRLKTYSTAKINKVEQKEVKQNPPLLHDLTSLQKEANKRFGYSADKTLSIAQRLYEHKLITYPRTGSRYITGDVFETVPALIEYLKSYESFSLYAGKLSGMQLSSHSVDDKKVTDHHALLVTGEEPGKLRPEETRIYELIIARMLESFSTPCIKDVTEVEVSCDEMLFQAKGWTIIDNGWRDVMSEPEENETKENNLILPPLSEGDSIRIDSHGMVQLKTKPKPLYTDAGLLSAMENAGNELEDKDARTALKDCGLGTPATRAGTIETLLKRGYIIREKKTIIPTEKGKSLYHSVKEMMIADVEMTGKWEMELIKIEQNPDYYNHFISVLKEHTRKITDEIISIIKAETEHTDTPHICPKCKLGKMSFYSKMAKCNYSKCRFIFYREICGKQLTEEELTELFKKHKTPLITGFKSKKGKVFDASIEFDKDGDWYFKFPHRNNDEEFHQKLKE